MARSTENAVLTALEAVLRDHGWPLAGQPDRLRATLSDVLGQHADEHRGLLDAVVISAEEGIPARIRAVPRDQLSSLLPELVAQLEAWGLATERADWVVTAWSSLLPGSTAAPAANTVDEATASTLPNAGPDATATGAAQTELPAAAPATELPAAVERPREVVPAAPTPPARDIAAQVDEGRPRGPMAMLLAVVLVIASIGLIAALTRGDDPGGSSGPKDKDTTTPKDSGESPGKSPGESPGITPPTPPVSGVPLVGVIATDAVEPEPASGSFAMASRKGGVVIDRMSELSQLTVDGTTYVAPEGGKLVAFGLADWPCGVDPCRSWERLPLSVEAGGVSANLPSGGDTFVASVPADTEADLVLLADGYEQRLSLLTGAPGPKNITVLAREVLTQSLKKRFKITQTNDRAVSYGDLAPTTRIDRQVTVTSAALAFFTTDTKPASTQRAYLLVDASWTRAPGEACPCRFELEVLKVVGPDGTSYPAQDLDLGPKRVVAFAVPATFTTGTFVIGGPYEDTATFSGSQKQQSYTARLTPDRKVDLSFP